MRVRHNLTLIVLSKIKKKKRKKCVMQTNKIYMTADWHLGKSPYGDRVLEEDFYEAANSVIDLAIKNDIKIILNAGDVFDANKPKMAAVDALFKINQKLIEHKIIMYTMMGNHDFTIDGSWCSLMEQHDDIPYGIKDMSNKAVMIDKTKVVAILGKTKSELIEKLSDPMFCFIVLAVKLLIASVGKTYFQ